MEKQIFNLKIEKAVNGYILYDNENVLDLNSVTAKKIPYVFETLEALFNFMEKNFKIETL